MNILVSAIGGNLGQAICKTIYKHYSNANIIGMDAVNPLQGYGLCNELIKVPFANSINYMAVIKQIVKEHEIDLIIPCNDFEIEKIVENDLLKKITLASELKTISTFFDKYLCYTEFNKVGIEFCSTSLPSNYKSEFEKIIVKPRKGSGSKGVVKNPTNLLDFDDKYIIQELKEGIELTIPFYVNLNNQLLGFLPLIKFGIAPNNSYQTYNMVNNKLHHLLLKIVNAFKIKGPCNLQCILNDDDLYPFELNCRYSGSVDIQDELGFDILRIGIEEYFNNIAYLHKPNISNGFAVRQYQSKVFINKEISDDQYSSYE